MKLKGKTISIRQIIYIMLYYCICYYLPSSDYLFKPIGNLSKKMRYLCCKNIFKKCGKNVNIEHRAYFSSGINIQIGDNSGIGINSCIPGDTIIGNNVMMGPNCFILGANHAFKNINTPMIYQGFAEPKQTIIGDDVWIGRGVLMTPGRIVKRGTIIAGGCVLCRNFPEYSIVGGNPSILISSRMEMMDC